jgi:EGF-like domain
LNCPNHCSGHGLCNSNCTCFNGFHGIDCSLLLCPSGRAWFDIPSADDVAHANYTECSNKGSCDRATGMCACNYGYTGAACERNLCPIGTTASKSLQPCSGHGQCISTREQVKKSLFAIYASTSAYNEWDADMVHGCLCHDGWLGVACNLRTCPKGDDPITVGRSETQFVDCVNSNSVGSLILSFGGESTKPIPFDASADVIRWRLKSLSSIEDVSVVISSGSVFCSSEGSLTEITFLLPQKPTFRLIVSVYDSFDGWAAVRADGEVSMVNQLKYSIVGTKESVECSNRGICDESTGTCSCFAGYASSDGLGGLGTRGDCGFTSLDGVDCPLYNGLSCGGGTRGLCNSIDGTCACLHGFEGADCSSRSCQVSSSWFGPSVSLNTSLHRIGSSTCSGVGDCDTSTGTCVNCGGSFKIFAGDGCQKLACLVTGTDSRNVPTYCHGNGVCLTLRQMSLLALTPFGEHADISYDAPWDSDMVQGCACFRKESIDNQYDPNYEIPEDVTVTIDGSVGTVDSFPDITSFDDGKFYRGPFAFTATNYIGANCDKFSCPTGDNPDTYGDDEIQALRCRAQSGFFSLSFRNNRTMPIPATSTVSQLEYMLEQLYTIHDVEVSINGTDDSAGYVCSVYDQRGLLLKATDTNQCNLSYNPQFCSFSCFYSIFIRAWRFTEVSS